MRPPEANRESAPFLCGGVADRKGSMMTDTKWCRGMWRDGGRGRGRIIKRSRMEEEEEKSEEEKGSGREQVVVGI